MATSVKIAPQDQRHKPCEGKRRKESRRQLSVGDVCIYLCAGERTVPEETGDVLHAHALLQEMGSDGVAQLVEGKPFTLYARIFAETVQAAQILAEFSSSLYIKPVMAAAVEVAEVVEVLPQSSVNVQVLVITDSLTHDPAATLSE